MKYASAMKYGGELVNAIECDYDSFKQLVPLCPECKEPVYLRAGGERRSSKGKPYKIGAHWCHFKGVSDEQVASCESRVNGYSEKDKQRIANKARGQRLKLLQRWFWKVWKDNSKSYYMYVKGGHTAREYAPVPDDIIRTLLNNAKSALSNRHDINSRIACEVFDYLSSKKQKPILDDMLKVYETLLAVNIWARLGDDLTIEIAEELLGALTVSDISAIPWNKLFDEEYTQPKNASFTASTMRLAKLKLIKLLRDLAENAGHDEYVKGLLPWRVNRSAPSYGVWADYPLPVNGRYGGVWDEVCDQYGCSQEYIDDEGDAWNVPSDYASRKGWDTSVITKIVDLSPAHPHSINDFTFEDGYSALKGIPNGAEFVADAIVQHKGTVMYAFYLYFDDCIFIDSKLMNPLAKKGVELIPVNAESLLSRESLFLDIDSPHWECTYADGDHGQFNFGPLKEMLECWEFSSEYTKRSAMRQAALNGELRLEDGTESLYIEYAQRNPHEPTH